MPRPGRYFSEFRLLRGCSGLGYLVDRSCRSSTLKIGFVLRVHRCGSGPILKLLSMYGISIALRTLISAQGVIPSFYRFLSGKRIGCCQVIFPLLHDDPICPVAAVRAFLASCPATLGSTPFFIDALQCEFSPKRFTKILRFALANVGVVDVSSFSSKSFRVGAASDAFVLAVPASSIQALGRWKSLAFMDYVRDGARASLASDVQSTLAGLEVPVTPLLPDCRFLRPYHLLGQFPSLRLPGRGFSLLGHQLRLRW